MKNNRRLGTLYIITLIVLVALSITIMASVSFPRSQKVGGNNYHYLFRHIAWLFGGGFCFWIFSSIDYRKYKKIKGHVYVIGLMGLILVLFFGKNINGARRWFSISGFNLQPSEFAKIILIITLAGIADLYKRKRRTQADLFLSMLVLIGIYAGLILAEKSFSSTIQIVLIGLALMFISGAKLLPFSILVLFICFSGFAAIFMSSYRKSRFLNHLGAKTLVYQNAQSLIAVGSGKLFGRFYGNGLQKYTYLPEIHTDYIFSGYAEEMGFIGAIILMTIYVILLTIIVLTIIKIKDRYAKYLLVGIFTMLSVQIVGNIAVTLGLTPSTGIPLPLMSYGGSSTIVAFIAFGIVYNIIKKSYIPKNIETNEMDEL